MFCSVHDISSLVHGFQFEDIRLMNTNTGGSGRRNHFGFSQELCLFILVIFKKLSDNELLVGKNTWMNFVLGNNFQVDP